MLFPPAVNYMYELFKYGKYNVTEADPAMAEHYLALLTAINKKESSSELYNRYIKLKENYPKEKAGRCDELLKLESELGRRTDIHDLVLFGLYFKPRKPKAKGLYHKRALFGYGQAYGIRQKILVPDSHVFKSDPNKLCSACY